jgi:Spherulation-specific family 4
LLGDVYSNKALNVKIYWILTIFIPIIYALGSTIPSISQQQIIELRSDGIALNQMPFMSQQNYQSKLQILLPLYIYPNWYDKNNYVWKQVITAAQKVPIVAIINPNNGPDRSPPNSDYQQGIKDLHQAGVKVIGYVPSNYAKRDLQAVEADIDLYIKYFNVEGIFIDEATSTQEKVGYYQQIYRYIKSRSNSIHQHDLSVIVNPGMNIEEECVDRSIADTIVIFENYQKVWNDYRPPAYLKKYAPQRFAALIHTTANRKLMKSTLDRAVEFQFGYIYITNDSTDNTNHNPWDALPEYWQAEVNYIHQLNERASSKSIDETNKVLPAKVSE